ncbi:MAG: hypothetical protein LLG04_16315 [Parachlamydia sp.]|nr:hypothetical protein [Parachlamydia sp.]
MVNLVTDFNSASISVSDNVPLKSVDAKIKFFNQLAESSKVPEYPQNRVAKPAKAKVLKRAEPAIEEAGKILSEKSRSVKNARFVEAGRQKKITEMGVSAATPAIEVRDIELICPVSSSIDIAKPSEKNPPAPAVKEKFVSAAIVKDLSPRQKLMRRLEEINALLNEKNESGFIRKGPYYLALADKGTRFLWRPCALPSGLKKDEQKEAYAALMNLLNFLNLGREQGILELKDIFQGEVDGSIRITRVLEKVTRQERCQELLINKKESQLERKELKKLRRGLIHFYYHVFFSDMNSEAQALKDCLLASNPNMQRLIETLSFLQFKAFSQDVQKIIESGRPLVQPLVSPRAGSRPVKSQQDMINAIKAKARTSQLKERIQKEQDRTFKTRMDLKAFQMAWTHLDEESKADFYKKNGLASVCGQLNAEEVYLSFLQYVVLKPQKISVHNTRSIVEFKESFNDSHSKLCTYLGIHEKWSEASRNLRKFISKHYSGEMKANLVSLYNEGKYDECLLAIFEGGGQRNILGNVKDMFTETVKDMIKRSSIHLRASQVSESTLQGFQKTWQDILEQKPIAWQLLPGLIAQTLGEFERLKLA